jgi:hypothetical protein
MQNGSQKTIKKVTRVTRVPRVKLETLAHSKLRKNAR